MLMIASLAADCCIGFKPTMLRICVGLRTFSSSLPCFASAASSSCSSSVAADETAGSFELTAAASSEIDGFVSGGGGGGATSGVDGDIGQEGE